MNGIPVTSVPRTLLDLAEVVSSTQLQRAYEEAERFELLDVRAIRRLLVRSNGRRGAGRLSALLDHDPAVAARTRSELERCFLDLMRRAGVPTPLVNALVAGSEVDAYWPSGSLVVELQSYGYHRGRAAFENDHAKFGKLKLAGYEVLPLTHRQVTEQPDWVIEAVRSLLARGRGG